MTENNYDRCTIGVDCVHNVQPPSPPLEHLLQVFEKRVAVNSRIYCSIMESSPPGLHGSLGAGDEEVLEILAVTIWTRREQVRKQPPHDP